MTGPMLCQSDWERPCEQSVDKAYAEQGRWAWVVPLSRR